MLTAEMVMEVARTGLPVTLPTGWTLGIDRIVRDTRSSDWDGCFYLLKPGPAGRLARAVNKEKPWAGAEKIKQIAARTPKAIKTPAHKIIEGEAVLASENN